MTFDPEPWGGADAPPPVTGHGTQQHRPRASWAITRQLVLLPLIVVLGFVAPQQRFFWRWLLHSWVEEYDSYGLTVFGMTLLSILLGLIAWCVCWFLMRRPRALLAGQLIALLLGPLVVGGWYVNEARYHPATAHDVEVVARKAADEAAAPAVTADWAQLPA